MSPEQKEMLRDALLASLAVSFPLSLPLATLRMAARAAGFNIDDAALSSHVGYLVGKDLAETSSAKLSTAVTRCKATAAGIDYCESARLI